MGSCPGFFSSKYRNKYLSPWCICTGYLDCSHDSSFPQVDCFFCLGKELSSSMMRQSIRFHSIMQGSGKGCSIQNRDSTVLKALECFPDPNGLSMTSNQRVSIAVPHLERQTEKAVGLFKSLNYLLSTQKMSLGGVT